MDTNNNSNQNNDMDSQAEQTAIKSEPPSQDSSASPNNNSDQNRDTLELFVKYEASDTLDDHESGTQTPIEDEPQASQQENNAADNEQANEQAPETTDTTTTSKSQTNLEVGNKTKQTESGVIQVKESEEDGFESIEIELEEDGSLLLTSLTSLFPDATGLKYRHPETNTLRGVKLADGRFAEPLDGWASVETYICVFNRGAKRKADEEEDISKKSARIETDKPTQDSGSDLVVLGLPWTTTENTMRTYFEQYGEVVMVQVKTDPKSGKSRGFGFVRFAKSSIQNKLLSMRHFIDGRWCDVRVPLSKAEADASKAAQISRKIFVGRLPDNITTDDLRNHFSEYGTLTDVFIPKPFRNFAFVTFGTSDMAQSIFKHKHVIKGSQVQISEAIPRDSAPSNSHGQGFGSNVNNNIHPFNGNFNSNHYQNKQSNVGAGGGGGGGGAGGNMYQNSRKMHPSYYQMPSYSGQSACVDPSYVNHPGVHNNDYGCFAGQATSNYSNQHTSGVNGGQYYKMQQQQAVLAPNQPTYSNHGAAFSRGTYGSLWK